MGVGGHSVWACGMGKVVRFALTLPGAGGGGGGILVFCFVCVCVCVDIMPIISVYVANCKDYNT